MGFFKSKEKPVFTEEHFENAGTSNELGSPVFTIHEIPTAKARAAAEATLVNPFANMTTKELVNAGEKFAQEKGLDHLKEQFKDAALLARIAISEDPRGFENLDISEEDKLLLHMELDRKWKQPKELYFLVIMCSVAAAVQGVSSLWRPDMFAMSWPTDTMRSDGRDRHKWSAAVLP